MAEVLEGRRLSAAKGAAKRAGVSLEVYLEKRASGLRWCPRCRKWKDQAERPRSGYCRPCRREHDLAIREGREARRARPSAGPAADECRTPHPELGARIQALHERAKQGLSLFPED